MGIQVYGFWRSIASFRVRVALKLKAMSDAAAMVRKEIS